MAPGAAAQPAAAELLDSLEADHARIAPAADVTAARAREYTASTDDTARVALIEALDGLVEVLVPHLDREVAEAMPVVAASITDREWDAVEQQYNIKPKTKWHLAMEGHWLVEGIDAEGYDIVVHKVPVVLRFVLLHGFGPVYRRRAEARWTPTRRPSWRQPRDGHPQEEGRRPYRSARRQQQAAQTRALVLAAATSLFADRGWSSTGMRDIAKAAGVAVETVYASFGSKTGCCSRPSTSASSVTPSPCHSRNVQSSPRSALAVSPTGSPRQPEC